MKHWDRVEAFVEVVRQGAFSAAARQLKVSASHISRLVSQLEAELGVQLLYRTTRQIRLTEAGELYHQHCRHALDGFREAEAALGDMQASPRGLLKLTASTTFGEQHIAPLVNRFVQLHPQIEVRMHFTNRRVALIDEGYDIGIRMGELQDSSLIARRLCDRREHVVASPDYLRTCPAPAHPNDLSRHRCLIGTLDHWRFRIDGQRREIRVSGRWQANSGPALLDATLRGLGLSQLPDYYVDEHIAKGSLVPVLEDFRFGDTGVWAVYPRHRHLSPKVRQFVDYLAEQLGAAT
jgi:DNA-binding transcriptional LysR family regulator